MDLVYLNDNSEEKKTSAESKVDLLWSKKDWEFLLKTNRTLQQDVEDQYQDLNQPFDDFHMADHPSSSGKNNTVSWKSPIIK